MPDKSVAGWVAKVTLMGCVVVAGAIVGMIAVAFAYRQWVAPRPMR